MAKKPLSGKRWFYAAGSRAASTGKPLWLGQYRQQWPQWAKDAYTDGWCYQQHGDWLATEAAHGITQEKQGGV